MKAADFKGAVAEISFETAVDKYGPAQAGRVYVRDAGCNHLIMMVTPSKRSWLTRPRVRGASQPLKLTWDKSVSRANVSDARDWANRAHDAAKDGKDPRLDPALDPRKARLTAAKVALFEDVAKDFLDSPFIKNELRASTRAEWTRVVNKHLKPAFKGKTVDAITREDVIKLRDDCAATPRQANVNLEVLAALIRWHKALPKKAPTVCAEVAKFKANERNRVLNDDELKAILAAARMPEAGRYGDLVRLSLLTGLRRDNCEAMEWSWIGADGVLRVPEAAHKNGCEHWIPLSGAALAIINKQPHIDGSPYVFPGSHEPKSPITITGRTKVAFDKLADIKPWVFHDLRRTCRTRLGELGVLDEIAELFIGHKRKGIVKTYDVSRRLPALKEAGELLAAHYDTIERKVPSVPSGIAAVPIMQAAE